MLIAYLKSLHIIFVVTWFAGLFYMVRLFIYHAEASGREEPEKSILQKQYLLMEKRLWYVITWPSAILAVGIGLWLVYELNYWLRPWMLVKFSLVTGLILYHLFCGRIYRDFRINRMGYSVFFLRLLNEGASLFLVAIVFVVVLKDAVRWVWGITALVILALVIALFIRFYKRNSI